MATNLGLSPSRRGLSSEDPEFLLIRNLELSFLIAKTIRVNKKSRLTAENRALWEHGDRKMNSNQIIAFETKDELPEEGITEIEHSREVSHEEDMIISPVEAFFPFPQPFCKTKILNNSEIKNQEICACIRQKIEISRQKFVMSFKG